MGDWYVIANIPTFVEKDAYNAVETYKLNDDGSVATTFTFNKGAFDGKLKEYSPTGFVTPDTGNARWGMRFIWPIKADYRVIYLNDDYTLTIIGRKKRDYLWIMARAPKILASDLEAMIDFAVANGYSRDKIQLVPQK